MLSDVLILQGMQLGVLFAIALILGFNTRIK
jgi:hypothetical protein